MGTILSAADRKKLEEVLSGLNSFYTKRSAQLIREVLSSAPVETEEESL